MYDVAKGERLKATRQPNDHQTSLLDLLRTYAPIKRAFFLEKTTGKDSSIPNLQALVQNKDLEREHKLFYVGEVRAYCCIQKL